MPMRDHANLKDITIPPEQEAIMNIVCETWDECRESECQNCPDRPKEFMSLMECFSLNFSRKLMKAGYAPVVRCKSCVWWEACGRFGTVGKCESPHNGLWNEYTYAGDYCSYGERKEE